MWFILSPTEQDLENFKSKNGLKDLTLDEE